MTDDARPGSYASLDHRVTALETRMSGLETQVALATERLDVVKSMGSATHDAVKHLESIIQQALRDPYSVMPRAAVDERDEWKAWRATATAALEANARAIDAEREARERADSGPRDQIEGAKRVGLIVLAVLGGLSSVVSIAIAIYRGVS